MTPVPLVVLDDDPTGTQSVAGIPVVLDWSGDALAETLGARPRAVHVQTNARALEPAEARTTTARAAASALATGVSIRFLLRGDSTLRGHVLEEYLGLCDAAFAGRTPPLVIAPALPAAGRVTIGGVHFLLRGDARVPLHETEYARDGRFAYRHSELLRWADERSLGFFAAGRGTVVSPRAHGADALVDALRVRAGTAAVVVVDAETDADLELAADGVRTAQAAGIELVARGAPAFAAALAGTWATSLAPPPAIGGGILVICGSYVPTTSRQLGALARRHPGTLVEADIAALDVDRAAEIERMSGEATRLLAAGRLAVVATPRREPPPGTSLATGLELARGLAAVARRVGTAAGVVLAKGGITSAVVARDGLGAEIADVVGPVASGVARWSLRGSAGAEQYLVFPGNVGDDEALADVVDLVLGA